MTGRIKSCGRMWPITLTRCQMRLTMHIAQRPPRALRLAAFDTNCRTGSGSIHRLDNECRRVLFRARREAGAWTWRRQVLACAIINDATPKKIAAVKVTVSKGSQLCTYSSI